MEVIFTDKDLCRPPFAKNLCRFPMFWSSYSILLKSSFIKIYFKFQLKKNFPWWGVGRLAKSLCAGILDTKEHSSKSLSWGTIGISNIKRKEQTIISLVNIILQYFDLPSLCLYVLDTFYTTNVKHSIEIFQEHLSLHFGS